MKILVGADVPPDPNSGAAGTVVATNVALRGLGHEVESFWSSDLSHRISHWNLHYWLELPREYRREVSRRCEHTDFDVIQLSQPHAWLAARDHRRRRRRGVFVNRSHGLESLLEKAIGNWKGRKGMPESRFPHSLLSPFLRRRLRAHIDRVVRYADGMLVPAQDIVEQLVREHGADPARIAVVPHGIPDAFLEQPGLPPGEGRDTRMIYVGQYSMIKGPWLLANAVARVLARNPGATMTWVCAARDHPRVLEHFPQEMHGRLSLHDWMPQEQLITLLDQHGIFLFPSLFEGFGKAPIEAMARGLCVVASDTGGMRDYIRRGENGALVSIGDSEGMARSALEFMVQPELATATGARAARTALSHTWDRCAGDAEAFYARLISKRKDVASKRAIAEVQ
jgi:glycosyltransferase involved in cell wall biosynthesis